MCSNSSNAAELGRNPNLHKSASERKKRGRGRVGRRWSVRYMSTTWSQLEKKNQKKRDNKKRKFPRFRKERKKSKPKKLKNIKAKNLLFSKKNPQTKNLQKVRQLSI